MVDDAEASLGVDEAGFDVVSSVISFPSLVAVDGAEASLVADEAGSDDVSSVVAGSSPSSWPLLDERLRVEVELLEDCDVFGLNMLGLDVVGLVVVGLVVVGLDVVGVGLDVRVMPEAAVPLLLARNPIISPILLAATPAFCALLLEVEEDLSAESVSRSAVAATSAKGPAASASTGDLVVVIVSGEVEAFSCEASPCP